MKEKRDNSGSISKNKRKEKETHPDYKGSAVVGGESYWISGWLREGEDGKWLSLAFEVREEQAAKPQAAARQVAKDEDIPF